MKRAKGHVGSWLALTDLLILSAALFPLGIET